MEMWNDPFWPESNMRLPESSSTYAVPLYHGPFESDWYSMSPRILPHNVFINETMLAGSSTATGIQSASTEGAEAMMGEFGREVCRCFNKRLLAFLSLLDEGVEGVSGCLGGSAGVVYEENGSNGATPAANGSSETT
jgi:hypothetical protein